MAFKQNKNRFKKYWKLVEILYVQFNRIYTHSPVGCLKDIQVGFWWCLVSPACSFLTDFHAFFGPQRMFVTCVAILTSHLDFVVAISSLAFLLALIYIILAASTGMVVSNQILWIIIVCCLRRGVNIYLLTSNYPLVVLFGNCGSIFCTFDDCCC